MAPKSSPYQPAATLLNQLWDEKQKKSLKNLVFDKKGASLLCSKTTYAQVCQVQKHRDTLETVINQMDSVPEVKNVGLLYVLLYELLLGPNKGIRGGGQLKRQLLKRENELRRVLATTRPDQSHERTLTLPRYVRVNTCQASASCVVEQLGHILSLSNPTKNTTIYMDPHVPDLLVLPSQSTAIIKEHQSKLLLDGEGRDDSSSLHPSSIVLQDKSSCFPALCLARGFVVSGNEKDNAVAYLDACAAPGNKTTHLAALTASASRIYALDRDKERYQMLKGRVDELVNSSSSYGKPRIVAQQQDFLATKPEEYPSVRGILLDPTCSGSGIVANSTKRQQDDQRLTNLAHFQYKALKHACQFPAVNRIVYSTCSIHDVENEAVVARVLQEYAEEWEVVSPICLAHWTRRGNIVEGLTSKQAAAMIRVDALEDETNGFFVCCLQRPGQSRPDDDEQQAKIKDLRRHFAKQAKQLGLPLYSGEFATEIPAKSSQTKRMSKRSADVDEDKPSKKSKHDGTKGDAALDEQRPKEDAAGVGSVHDRKRAKRAEWRQKQRQLKLERIKKKKENQRHSK